HELRRIAKRDRHNRDARLDRLGPFIFVLMKPKPRLAAVEVQQADVGLDLHSAVGGDSPREVFQILRKSLNRQVVMIRTSLFVLVGLRVPVPAETDHLDAHISAAANRRSVETSRLTSNIN